MATCVFVASGLNFPVDEYLRRSPYKDIGVFRKGEVPPKENPDRIPRPDSGFTVLVGSDENLTVDSQVSSALRFLVRHEQDLLGLRKAGVDNMLFDFGTVRGDELQQSVYFPPEFVISLARFGMGLMTSTVILPRG